MNEQLVDPLTGDTLFDPLDGALLVDPLAESATPADPPSEDADVAELLAARLRSALQVTTLVGDRIRPDLLDEGDALPAIVYGLVSSDPYHHLGGAAGAALSRVQFNSYALTRRAANRVAKQIEDVLDGFAGRLAYGAGAARPSIHVYDCALDNDYARVDAPTPGAKNWRYRRVVDFVVSHSKQIPTLTLSPIEE